MTLTLTFKNCLLVFFCSTIFPFSFHFGFCFRALARDGNGGGCAKSPTPESATLPFSNLGDSGEGDFEFFNEVADFAVWQILE